MSALSSMVVFVIFSEILAVSVDGEPPRSPTLWHERQVLRSRVRDPNVTLESKQEQLRAQLATPWNGLQSHAERAQDFSAIAGDARPAEHQYALCLTVARALGPSTPTQKLRITAVNSWGDEAAAVLLEGEVLRATLPVSIDVPECLPWLVVRFVPDGPSLTVVPDGDHAVARVPGNGPLLVVSSLTQVSWVYPGWRDGTQVHLSAGARLVAWRRWLHADVGIKLSTFSVPWLAATPGGLSLDAFVGFPWSFAFEHWQLRLALDVGMWSTFCPTIRGAAAFVIGEKLVLSAEYATHLYPMSLVAPIERPRPHVDVPFENYLFWSVGLAAGLAL